MGVAVSIREFSTCELKVSRSKSACIVYLLSLRFRQRCHSLRLLSDSRLHRRTVFNEETVPLSQLCRLGAFQVQRCFSSASELVLPASQLMDGQRCEPSEPTRYGFQGFLLPPALGRRRTVYSKCSVGRDWPVRGVALQLQSIVAVPA